MLETDIALTNVALDLFGQTRNYFQLAAKLTNEIGETTSNDQSVTEDDLAFLRAPHEYKNVLLVEQPNTDFAHVIVRQWLFDQYHQLVLMQLGQSNHQEIAAIARKSLKEVSYHIHFSSQWVIRLGDGTDVSQKKVQTALDTLYPFTRELFITSETEKELAGLGIAVDPETLLPAYEDKLASVCEEAKLKLPDTDYFQKGGKEGRHTEHFGYILAELQYMQRTYPQMEW